MIAGTARIGTIAGIPIHCHWSILVFMMGGFAVVSFDFLLGLGFQLGVFFLILVHELGHAALVRLLGKHVVQIVIVGWGGECSYVDAGTPLEQSVIAWGGVVAQAIVLGAVGLLVDRGRIPNVSIAAGFFAALVAMNVFMMILNLIPHPALDGYRAWQLPYHLYRRLRTRTVRTPPKPRLRVIRGGKGRDSRSG